MLNQDQHLIRSSHVAQSGERGVFIVIGALWMSVLLMIAALAIDTYMLANSKLQQGNTVEAMALTGLRALLDPPSGATPPAGTGDESPIYNFAIQRAALLAQSPLMGTSTSQVSASQLFVHVSNESEDQGEDCSGGDDGGDCNFGHCDDSEHPIKDHWCGFEGASDVGAVIFGTYDPALKKFTPVAPGASATINAVSIRLQLQGEQGGSAMVLPMMRTLMKNGSLMFESKATVYREPSGRYRVVTKR